MDKGIQDELKSMGSPLAGMSQAMPYSVPQGYFVQFEKQLLDIIDETGNPRIDLNAARSAKLGSVPPGYFDELPGRLLEMAKAGTEQKSLQVDVARPRARRRIALGGIRWAAAAMLVIAVGIGSYKFLFNHSETGTDNMLSSVPGNELQEYLQSTCRIDVDRVVNNNTLTNMKLDNKDIISYLDETGWDIVD